MALDSALATATGVTAQRRAIEEKGKQLDFQECGKIMNDVPVAVIEETDLFLDGDHWQKGAGWVGYSATSNTESAAKINLFIEKTFVAENVMKGMVKRLIGATLGKMPDHSIVYKKQPNAPKADEATAKAIDELNVALNDWWVNKKVHRELKKFLHNRISHGKACLRIYIPQGYLDANLDITDTDLPSVLSKIYVKAHKAGTYNDREDVDFGERYTVIKLKSQELNEAGEKYEQTEYEVCYIDRNKKTVLRKIVQDGKGDGSRTLDLKGNSLHYIDGEFGDSIMSPTIKSQQKVVNHAKTGENYQMANINFPETTLIDFEELPKKTVWENGKSVMKEVLDAGLGAWRRFVSRTYQTPEGGEAVAKGQLIYKPVDDPEKFNKVAENNKRSMHQEAGMLYIYLADSEYASGESKVASMTDYVILLTELAEILSTIGVWVFETPVRLAYRFTGDNTLLDKFTVTFTPRLTIGILSKEDKEVMMMEVDKNLRSRTSYRIEAGISDDPDGEELLIVDEKTNSPLAKLLLKEKQDEFNNQLKLKSASGTPNPAASGNGAGATA